jgi:hypothetical protein
MTHKNFDIGINFFFKKKSNNQKLLRIFVWEFDIRRSIARLWPFDTNCMCMYTSECAYVVMTLSNHFTRREKTIQWCEYHIDIYLKDQNPFIGTGFIINKYIKLCHATCLANSWSTPINQPSRIEIQITMLKSAMITLLLAQVTLGLPSTKASITLRKIISTIIFFQILQNEQFNSMIRTLRHWAWIANRLWNLRWRSNGHSVSRRLLQGRQWRRHFCRK